jgi:hypothetical protein
MLLLLLTAGLLGDEDSELLNVGGGGRGEPPSRLVIRGDGMGSFTEL